MEAFVGVSARCSDINPVAVVGIIRSLVVGADGSNCEYIVLLGRIAGIGGFVAGGEDDETARHRTGLTAVLVHTGVGVEVVDVLRDVGGVGVDAPAAVDKHRAVVGGIDKGVTDVRRAAGGLGAHQAHSAALAAVTARDAADSDTVVVDGRHRAAHVHAVVARLDGTLHSLAIAADHEVVAIDVIDVAVAVIIYARLSV